MQTVGSDTMKNDDELEIVANGMKIQTTIKNKYDKTDLKYKTSATQHQSKNSTSKLKNSFNQFYTGKEVLQAFEKISKQSKQNKKLIGTPPTAKKHSVYKASPNEKQISQKQQESPNNATKSSSSKKMHNPKRKQTKKTKQPPSYNRTASGTGLTQVKMLKDHTNYPKQKGTPPKKYPPIKKYIRQQVLSYPIRSFVYDKERKTYHRVENCNDEMVSLHIQGTNTYSLSLNEARRRLRSIRKLHIGVLKKYYSKEFIRSRVFSPSIYISTEIIKYSHTSLEEMHNLHVIFVPEILTETEWNNWVDRVDHHLNSPLKNKIVTNVAIKSAEEIQIKPIRKVQIMPQDFIIKVHNFKCINNGHQLESIMAVMYIRKSSTEGVIPYKIPAGYCPQCKKYFIHSDVYESHQLFRLDVTSDIIDEIGYRNKEMPKPAIWDNHAKESTLKKCGYCVNQTENLDQKVRLKILYSIIQHNIMGKMDILDFLNWLIETRKHIPQMNKAIRLWHHDYLTLSAFEVGRSVDVKTVRRN